jgi:hypothetical protein
MEDCVLNFYLFHFNDCSQTFLDGL